MSTADFLSLLKSVKPAGRNQWLALCPSHHDTKQSLSVKEADGKILVKCFAGCELTDILKPLGLEPKDLFLDSHEAKLEHREIEAIYCYVDANGRPFEVVRTKPKGFYQRRPNGEGGYINNLKGIVTTLYHQDELKQAIDGTELIYLPEGEKDADRLRDLGLVAVTNPMGAGKWRKRYSGVLYSADLIILPDNDEPGHNHADYVAESCYGAARRIRILEISSECKDISDWLDKGGSREQLIELVSRCPDYKPSPDILPEISITNRHLRDMTADALEALYKANEPKRIFRRSNILTRIGVDEKERPCVEALHESSFRGCLERSANFKRITLKEDGWKETIVPPPFDIVRDCLSLGQWQFPPLLGITEAPVLRPDGTILTLPGYDSVTNLYYCPAPELKMPPIPDKPIDGDVKAAAELILEIIRDFSFDSDASRANAIATMFTPILRPMLPTVPLAIMDKPQPGTGASLLAEIITLIATGRDAAMQPAPKSDEEWNKIITVTVLKGQLVLTIDNIESQLQSASLATLLTATTWRGRILGKSDDIILPNIITPIATGNNIRLGGDLPRRCIWIRMDVKMPIPWLRGTERFKHPELVAWVLENRGAILAAILTITRAWVVAGMPKDPKTPNLGGYEAYSRILGGVLAFMGISGFLKNLRAMYDQMDIETPQWEGFLEAWHTIKKEPITATELAGYISSNEELRATLPEAIGNTKVENYVRRLGIALAKKQDVRFPNGFYITKAGELRRAVCWQVIVEDSHSFTHECESCESRTTQSEDEKKPYGKGVKTDTLDSHLHTKVVSLEGEDLHLHTNEEADFIPLNVESFKTGGRHNE